MNRIPADLLGPKSDAVRGAQLLLQSKNRRAQSKFLAEGPQAVTAAIESGIVQALYAVPAAADLLGGYGGRIYWLTEAALKSITETENPQGVVALCQIPTFDLESISHPTRILICHETSDPGNLGTIIRTAAAAGYEYVITTAGSADVWSGKVVRSTAGMFSTVKVLPGLTQSVIFDFIEKNKLQSIATTGFAEIELTSPAALNALSNPHALWIGNEAHGLPEDVIDRSLGLRIPMAAGVESLNAAVAAALCMYAYKFATGS